MAAPAPAASDGLPEEPGKYTADDGRRAREFYHYLQPENLTQSHLRRRPSTRDALALDHMPSLSNALAPFCQLTTLVCNARKAMLNVMDRDIMYFLAEATKQAAIEAEQTFEFVEDPIFLHCSSAPLKGRICEITIKMRGTDDPVLPPVFVLPDLTKSDFANMDIVTHEPYYRFYAGVPITTKDGVNIGSLAIMDTKTRSQGLTASEKTFLATTARQIMLYLETNRHAIEGRRSRRMAQGLEAFIAGRKSIQDDVARQMPDALANHRPASTYGVQLPDQDVLQSPTRPLTTGLNRSLHRRKRSLELGDGEGTVSGHSSDTDEVRNDAELDGETRSHPKTFGRAANLLRESLGDLGEEGIVAFLSLSTTPPSSSSSGSNRNVERSAAPAVLSQGRLPGQDPLALLAFSTPEKPFAAELTSEERLRPIDEDVLKGLMKRYPGGRLWSLEATASSSEDDKDYPGMNGLLSEPPKKGSRRKELEIQALRSAFPSAAQVLFAPLWDATVGSFAHGCFVATALDSRSFSAAADLPFLNSFCSTLMAECNRLDTMMADKQKSDFVGTISHEMRSPLHGVLASVEFLAETDLSGFQKSLIATIDSCGRTLLDTINHVLDFSKVNSFQRLWQASNKKTPHGSRRNNFLVPDNASKSLSHGAPPLLQLFGITDVSAVLEEVVDGLVLGHMYSSGLDITDLSRESRGRGKTKTTFKAEDEGVDPVDIYLDVEEADWIFMTQPGAVRRIIMNITGNAIKYTIHGSINVQLGLRKDERDDAGEVVVLTVIDTGKGISQEFLDKRLFVPFAQENALAPGTGLGLSIVRSIVLMLGGTIEVTSKVNQGTKVQVVLPMKRPLPGQISTQDTPYSAGTTSSVSSAPDESITWLQGQQDVSVVFYDHEEPDSQLRRVVTSYIQDWCQLYMLDQKWCRRADVVVVEEKNLEDLVKTMVGTPGLRPALVVICSVLSRHGAAMMRSLEDHITRAVEFVAKPCGPHKLARSIRLALEKRQSCLPAPSSPGLVRDPESRIPTETDTAATSSSSQDPSPSLGEMDLNMPGGQDQAMLVQGTETFAASRGSENAQMAIREPAPFRTPKAHVSEGDSFPFPRQAEESSRVRFEHNRTSSQNAVPQVKPNTASTSIEAPLPSPAGTAAQRAAHDTVNPHVLLVDDNKINLKLLETFLKVKQKYTRVEQAEDGQQAVDRVKSALEPFDIIFMDISMPVLNGFEATRQIRKFEEKSGIKPGAMVIALTGLASGRDQAEVFESGCDIYMTKPVSFKEVAKLLKNWEGHQNTGQDIDDGN